MFGLRVTLADDSNHARTVAPKSRAVQSQPFNPGNSATNGSDLHTSDIYCLRFEAFHIYRLEQKPFTHPRHPLLTTSCRLRRRLSPSRTSRARRSSACAGCDLSAPATTRCTSGFQLRSARDTAICLDRTAVTLDTGTHNKVDQRRERSVRVSVSDQAGKTAEGSREPGQRTHLMVPCGTRKKDIDHRLGSSALSTVHLLFPTAGKPGHEV